MVYWSELRLVDEIFNVNKNTICMVIFNNLSGVTYRVSISKLGNIHDQKRLFYMSTADEFGNKKKLSVIENSATDYEVGHAAKKSKSYALDKPCNVTDLQSNKCEYNELHFDVLSGVGFAVQAFNFAYEKDDSML